MAKNGRKQSVRLKARVKAYTTSVTSNSALSSSMTKPGSNKKH